MRWSFTRHHTREFFNSVLEGWWLYQPMVIVTPGYRKALMAELGTRPAHLAVGVGHIVDGYHQTPHRALKKWTWVLY